MLTAFYSARLLRAHKFVAGLAVTLLLIQTVGVPIPAAAGDANLVATDTTAPNLVGDSNIESAAGAGPDAFAISVEFCNSGATHAIEDLVVHIGDGTTPGEFPDTVVPPGGPYEGTFELTLLSGSGNDATRLIGTLAPGACQVEYWLVAYPQLDALGNAVTGATNDINDDLELNWSFWGAGVDKNGTPLNGADDTAVVVSGSDFARVRNEIKAASNKVQPNGGSTIITDGATVALGDTVTVQFVGVDFGLVNQGFDADGDLNPDYDLWFQAIGEAGLWDSDVFRLVRIDATLVGSGGGCTAPPGGITTVDQVYFSGLDAYGNCSWDGTYTYTFVAIGIGSATIAPYQEVASGSDNEKYNTDYCGDDPTSNPNVCVLLTVTNPGDPTLLKSVDQPTAAAGATLTWTISYSNSGSKAQGSPLAPPTIEDSIPANTSYVAGSATCSAPCDIYYSVDGGSIFASLEPADPTTVTDLRWVLDDGIPAAGGGTVGFQSVADGGYSGRVPNAAEISFGGGPPVANATAESCIACADVYLSKTVSEGAPVVGGTVTYTITVGNDAAALGTATGVFVSDLLPAGVTYVPASESTTQGSYTPGTGVWDVGTLTAGSTATLTVDATVDSGTEGQTISNVAEVTAHNEPDTDSTPNNNEPAEDDQDSADINVADPQIAVEKTTNGQDADTAPGPYVAVGGAVNWVYTVTNPGNVELDTVSVTDDIEGVIAGPDSGDTDADSRLDPGETWVYTSSSTAGAGQYANTATAQGTPPSGPDVTDTDDSHYFGSDAQIVVEKATNGQDADAAPGPVVAVGSAVNWVFTVTNPGNVELDTVSLTDDIEGVIAGPDSGDTDADSRLDPGETWVYTASGTAAAGQYSNTVTAQGSPPVGPAATDTDDSHYFGSAPQILVEKSTNGQDADLAPGPYVAVGGAVNWVYTVTNPGNVELDTVSVSDDLEGVISGPDSGDTDADNRLDPGETWIYTASGTAAAGQYGNTATVQASPPVGGDVTDTDDSHYFGSAPQIVVEKATNGQDADTTPGPLVPVGNAVNWVYTVTNPGNVELDTVTVTDDVEGVVAGPDSGDTDADNRLDPGETWVYTASGTAAAGQYANTAIVSGSPPVGGDVSDTDDSHYFGVDAQVVVEKSTNGQDADLVPGPYVVAGGVVNWTYTVTNPGNVELDTVSVTDDIEGVISGPDSGDTDADNRLDPGETWIYTASGTAAAGQYTNTATVSGTPPIGPDATDTDDSHYFGSNPQIVVEKTTNGQDADLVPGPYVVTGGVVNWTYTVTNPGNVELDTVTVTDDIEGVIAGPDSGDTDADNRLDPGETWIYTASGTASAGQYTNTATVQGSPPVGGDVSDTDDSHYFGSDAQIVVEKTTNGQDADVAPGPYVAVGGAVNWAYTVTNPGNVELDTVLVTDDIEGVIAGPDSGDTDADNRLDPGETWVYTASGTAAAGQYTNTAAVSGTPPVGLDATDTDDSHYFGADPQVVIEKSTNGQDADAATGPLVPVGGAITWTYTVTNPGNVELSGVSVVDDQGVTVNFVGGDTDADGRLDPGETWSYDALGSAVAGQYENTGTATGTPPGGLPDASDDDQSHYYGSAPQIVVEKTTNGQDADTAPGPTVAVGGVINWVYTVTNPGNVELDTVSVTDDIEGVIAGPDSGDTDADNRLDPGETWVYTASGTAAAGQYLNTATVQGSPPVGGDVTDADDSHYFGSDAQIVVEKTTNGLDADTAPGPMVPVGGAVSWVYTVTNPGNVELDTVSVTDDIEGVIAGPDSGDSDADNRLDPGETWIYTASGTASAGQYVNTATVQGSPPVGPDATDTDDSHYFGSSPQIVVEKTTNGTDADTAPGPLVPVGGAVSWVYTVTNPGNVELDTVTVADDIEGGIAGPDSGDTDADNRLDPGETWIYTASGTASAGQYVNTATAQGSPPVGGDVTDTDDSHYFGSDAQIVVEKTTNGQDADAAPGPYVVTGGAVNWVYTVTNPGSVELDTVSVTDDVEGVIAGPGSGDTDADGRLDPGETWVYTAAGTATGGQYVNTATAQGSPPVGGDVTDTDDSHYFGSSPQIVVEKTTNGQDADTAPGPIVAVGGAVNWVYSVTNPGNVELDSVSVTDDVEGVIAGPGSGDTDTDGRLDPGETWVYTAAGTATGGQYVNTATVQGSPPVGGDVTDTDDSHYFGSDAQIVVEKTTNAQDADTAPGPYIAVGGAVIWVYTVTNPGNVELDTVSVTDDIEGVIAGPDSGDTDADGRLDPGETWVYTLAGTAAAGQYANTATVQGSPPVGPPVTATDDSHYYGSDPQIVVEKTTNGLDADTAPGAYVAVGGAINWVYTVTNPGNVELDTVFVTDDIEGLIAGPDSGDTDADGRLDPGETWVYTLAGTAAAGQYANTATVQGSPPVGGDVTDADDSHYYGSAPQIVVEKTTNGLDADTAPGAYVAVGGAINWVYTVTNPGNVELDTVSVIDDVEGAIAGPDSGDTDADSRLDPGETWVYTASGTASAGQYANTATVQGSPPVGPPVTDTDDSHYYGSNSQIVVEKTTNGQDADTAPGPYVAVGGAVNWVYTVTNPGNTELDTISVTDDIEGVIAGPDSGDTDADLRLDPGEIWVYTAASTAAAGQYANTATVQGSPPVGPDVSAADDSHYYGSAPQIVVEKTTNGQDADTAPGPLVAVGGAVNWVYTVTNPGNVELDAISVTDDIEGVIAGPDSGDTDADGRLDPGETWVYTASGTASVGQYANTVTVQGSPPVGPPVTGTDDSHYYGADAEIVVEKTTNGQDADAAPGPYVAIGGAISWVYTVTNPGNVELDTVSVTDDVEGLIAGPDSGDTDADARLDPGETWVYTASGTAASGQYVNTATVQGTPPVGPNVTDTDDSHYFGSAPQIVVEKTTNGQDADTAPGPLVAVGGAVNWVYSATNPGNVELDAISVTDDIEGVIAGPDSGDTDADSRLDPGETWVYTASGTASAGQYANTVTVQGSPPVGPPVTDTDDSHYYGPDGSISNFVYDDLNGNGIQDPGEPGIDGVTVTITGDGLDNTFGTLDDYSATVVTAGGGLYVFDELMPDVYRIDFTAPGTMVFTAPNVGADDAVDSDPDASGRVTTTLGVDENDDSFDAGLYTPVDLGDQVWTDVNGNGIQDGGEPGIDGVAVTLTGAGVDGIFGTGDDISAATTTAGGGLYAFTSLPPGDYRVNFTAPAGQVFTAADLGSDDAVDSDADALGDAIVALTSGIDDGSVDAGLYVPVEIQGEVWDDLNRDGIQDPGELPISGIPIDLQGAGPDGIFGGGDDLALATTTAADGSFSFLLLPPGSYRVAYTPPALFVLSPAGVGSDATVDSDPDSVSGVTGDIVLDSGEVATDIDAGMYSAAPVSIGDTVWNDQNGDGIQDPGEAGVAGVTVNVYDSADLGTVLATTTTDATGWYEFAGLSSVSDYVVEVVLPADALGFSPQDAGADDAVDSDMDPVSGQTDPIVVAAGNSYYDQADGGVIFPASIGDWIWFDADGDGVPDAGEPGLGGIDVLLLDGGGTVIATTTTAPAAFPDDPAAGSYLFEGLAPGTYTVRVDTTTLPLALTDQTFDSDGTFDGETSVTVAAGETVNTVDFAYTGVGSIGDTVWVDKNQNGIHDVVEGALEPGIPNVSLTVTWLGPDGIAGTADDFTYPVQVTDADGKYLYDNLPFGDYSIVVGGADDFVVSGSGVLSVTLGVFGGSGPSVLTVDFPFIATDGTGTLPTTGLNLVRLARFAALLLAVGFMLLAAAKRRRDETE